MALHQDTRKELRLGDRVYELRGFLKEGEMTVTVEEAIRRCDGDGQVVKSRDELQYFLHHQHEVPKILQTALIITAVTGTCTVNELLAQLCYDAEWTDRWEVQRVRLNTDCYWFAMVLRRIS